MEYCKFVNKHPMPVKLFITKEKGVFFDKGLSFSKERKAVVGSPFLLFSRRSLGEQEVSDRKSF